MLTGRINLELQLYDLFQTCLISGPRGEDEEEDEADGDDDDDDDDRENTITRQEITTVKIRFMKRRINKIKTRLLCSS